MPLQNRVDPFGRLIATPARGLFFGNRGGRFHRDSVDLGPRRWATKQWICCVLAFKGRRRQVWRTGYTELFFLDEPTALAAGHRPCFECRRREAEDFAARWAMAKGLATPPRAPEMDRVLHAERLDARDKRLHRAGIDELPDGAMIRRGDDRGWDAYAIHLGKLWRWTPAGYVGEGRMPRGVEVDVLTPPSIVAALAAGYRPHWHPSAG